jgi:hypothetical protein
MSTVLLVSSRVSDGGTSKNLILFIRENSISGAPSIRGANQFPNPPIIIGITMKKIITTSLINGPQFETRPTRQS